MTAPEKDGTRTNEHGAVRNEAQDQVSSAGERAELIEQTYRLGDEAAEQRMRADKAEAEVERLKEHIGHAPWIGTWEETKARADKAEARNAELEKAMRRIASSGDGPQDDEPWSAGIARRALSPEGKEGK